MKKFLSVLLVLCIVFSLAGIAYATEDVAESTTEMPESSEMSASDSYDSFKALFADYVTLYQGTYEPLYGRYVAKMEEYKSALASDTLSETSRISLSSLMAQVKNAHSAFYGDRVTFVTSRYDVPAARNLMRAQASAGDYDSAIHYCETLTSLIHARIGYLENALSTLDSVTLEVKSDEKPVEEPAEETETPLILRINAAISDELSAIYSKNRDFTKIDSSAPKGPHALRCRPLIDTEIGTYVNEQYSWAVTKNGNGATVRYFLYLADVDITTLPLGTVIDVQRYDSTTGKIYSGTAKIVLTRASVDGVSYEYNTIEHASFKSTGVVE